MTINNDNNMERGSSKTTGARRGLEVVVTDATKRFGEKAVLHSLSLSVRPGEFLAIVGRSGCGKSTLLRLVGGLDAISSGELTINGLRVKGVNDETRIMFQEHRLLPWKTVLQNVGLGMKGDWSTVALDALAQVGLKDKADNWPSMLSGGQRQRVALARALVHKPRLLLLDEPLGALDALTRIEMQLLIETLWKANDFTVILITHDVDEAVALADRVVLIEEGRIGMDERVELSRPRQRGSAGFGELAELVLNRVLKK
ncbi:sulfonate transport system ATP-binding protein [Paralcaligenes ureilyticus]|uniref:Sulfonate transport system ATP-binding protein n=2 Tax=Paralcaligenes ureilyticus TaxID=627131 RepID=A0A4R3LZ36_9BURK|nr:ATP-binding cassette domain-containing protein [Paralcaligenes ureilyticus]TCT04035.1 sulfonate transport system ATP-binding protein [Paralcaligenes ureilyticus]